jgi:guanine deaminase
MQNRFIDRVIELAVENVQRNGGPFAALVVKDSTVIATGVNQVTRANDPTAHAEIVAIREACRALGTFQLSGLDVYSSCEPCPMCAGALYWARPAHVFFAATQEDAAAAGFDDKLIYSQMVLPHSERIIPMTRVVTENATRPFETWVSRPDKIRY